MISRKSNWNRTIALLLVIVMGMVVGKRCLFRVKTPFGNIIPVTADLDKILARDTLRAVTGNNSTSYFIYKGQPMGYEYELLTLFARELGVALDIRVADDAEEFLELLHRGKVDIVANNLTITRERQQRLAFSNHFNTVRQVLVQRHPDNWHSLTADQQEQALIRDPIELIGKEVHVRKNSSFDQRLRHLSEEIGGDINIVYHDGRRSTEELMQMVSEGSIAYTVADENIAAMNASYLQNIDHGTAVSFSQQVGWAMRKTSPALLDTVNAWLAEVKKNGTYRVIYRKYFHNHRAFSVRADSEYHSGVGGAISVYDDAIRRYAAELGWDWRLLAAQIYCESRFDPRASSWAGALGLMQIVPETAERFGDSTRMLEPEYSIMLGSRYLKWLRDFWEEIPDSTQAVKFMLASYNVGEGHLLDARRLTEKYGGDPRQWDGNVDSFLVKKAYPEYYKDDVVYYGYCRGSEPFLYVNRVLETYRHYRQLLPG